MGWTPMRLSAASRTTWTRASRARATTTTRAAGGTWTCCPAPWTARRCVNLDVKGGGAKPRRRARQPRRYQGGRRVRQPRCYRGLSRRARRGARIRSRRDEKFARRDEKFARRDEEFTRRGVGFRRSAGRR
eukprot:8361177-Pyramimonas_sp.AAC.1